MDDLIYNEMGIALAENQGFNIRFNIRYNLVYRNKAPVDILRTDT